MQTMENLSRNQNIKPQFQIVDKCPTDIDVSGKIARYINHQIKLANRGVATIHARTHVRTSSYFQWRKGSLRI